MALSTNAAAVFNTLLKVCSDASGTSPTTVAEIRDIDLSLLSQVEDVTPQTAGGERCKIVTLLDKKVTATVNWLPTNVTHNDAAGLHYLWQNRVERTYQIVESDTSTIYQFNAVIASIKHGRPVAGARTAQIEFEGTGTTNLSA